MWHDLRFVHRALASGGLSREWKYFRRDLKRAWRQAQVEQVHFHIDATLESQVSKVNHICTSFALVMAFWLQVRSLRAREVASMVADHVLSLIHI